MNKLRYPTTVTIETTTVCNVIPPCVMCGKHIDPRSGWLNKDASHFPKELLPKIRSVLEHAEVLSLYGIGEPLTCPYLFDFRNYVLDSCHVQFTSNGWLFNAANIDKIIANRISLVDVSLDATTPDIYAKIRHGDFEETAQKIANLITERNRRNSLFPGITLNMCLMRENIDDLPGLPDLCKRVGANHCYAFHLNTGMGWKYEWFDYDQQHCSLDQERHDARVQETYERAKEIGVSFQFKGQALYKRGFIPPSFIINLPSTCFNPTPPPALDAVCTLPWQQVIIYRDGSISNCCWMDGFVGNLYEKSFEEIWFGDLQNAVRDSLLNKSFHARCAGKLICPPRGRP